MAAPNSNPETGKFSPEQQLQVREHLHQVLDGLEFAGSKRAKEFLQLIVDRALAGEFESLRERVIGSELFGRPIGYDTANDAVVRVKATEVRRRLAQFYGRTQQPWPVRIELPAGAYAPRFTWLADETGQPAAAAPEAATSAEPASMGRQEASGLGKLLASRGWLVWAAALVLLAGAGVFGLLQWRNAILQSPIRSLAILPLVNLSNDPGQDYFADGITEEITTELGQVASLRVISRTSSMTYKGTKKSLPEIARELHVDGIVEGSVQREGRQIRVTVQLIDARTDQHLWAHSYDRDMSNVLELQTDVARAIADQVRIELTPREKTQLSRTQQINPEAVELYLQGIQRVNNGNPTSGIDFFRQAIDKDPNYGEAHASLANALGWMGEAGSMPYSQAFGQERAEALKAIELGDTQPEPYLDLGFAAMDLNWDWKTLGENLRRGLALNPNAVSVHWAYANYLTRIGRTSEAVEEAEVALRLDPVSSRSYQNTCFIYYFARQYDNALEQIRRSETLNADQWEVLFPTAVIYVEKGLYDLADQKFQKLGDAPHALGHLGNAYARQGRVAEARALLPRLREHIDKDGIGRYEIALVYAGLKENDNAFEWLDKAYLARDKGLTYLKIDPCLDPLRSDPRFQPLLDRVGFPNEM